MITNMKKFILSCILMLCGVIGGTGWTIAYVIMTNSPTGYANIFQPFAIWGPGKAEGFIVILFYMIAVAGLVLAYNDLRDNRKGS